MGWENILKIKIRNVKDAKRVARDYAPKDLVEGFIVSQEEYDKMSNRDRQSYHRKIYNEYKAAGFSDVPEAKWHIRVASNLERNANTIIKPHPSEEDLKPKKKPKKKDTYRSILEGTGRRIYGPRKYTTARVMEGYTKRPKPKPEIRSKPIKQIIIDYFTMYNNRFGRNPTLQEIEEDEERPLTVDEIESFERYSQSR
jgi:hypothetical protein